MITFMGCAAKYFFLREQINQLLSIQADDKKFTR